MVKYPQKRMNGLIWESLNKGGEGSISGVKNVIGQSKIKARGLNDNYERPLSN